jgi:hypothetical protein
MSNADFVCGKRRATLIRLPLRTWLSFDQFGNYTGIRGACGTATTLRLPERVALQLRYWREPWSDPSRAN